MGIQSVHNGLGMPVAGIRSKTVNALVGIATPQAACNCHRQREKD
jgi:hypothetical protein